ncbi:MAG: DUF4011 domain-containing protein [Christensenellaceae bacterium]|jgi:very-short-patch-repair endonuclease|nr:DUF4011 domain-containing protein [Christensenellaceae bacterium]
MALQAKIDYWQKQLLDLGKRNRLINCPRKSERQISRSSLEIISPDIYQLWNFFNADTKWAYEVPLESTTKEKKSNNEIRAELLSKYQSDANTITNREMEQAIKFHTIPFQANQSDNDALVTLRRLKQTSRQFYDEKGVNVLFLAFGFLNWKEAGLTGIEMRSPLFLVPVEITQDAVHSPICIERRDDDIIINTALVQKLLLEFNINLPEYNEDLSIISNIEAVAKACSSIDFKIENTVEISMFSFLKVNMYQDLSTHRDAIIQSDLVKLIAGEKASTTFDLSSIKDFNYDKIDPSRVLSVVDADSSQQEAIAFAKEGVSFVLQGPPGTGKSQTITNIIAELLAQGKTVLFVAEKMAALDVVYKRLTNVGLDKFCLTLHSHKTKRKDVLNQLASTLRYAEAETRMQNEDPLKLKQLADLRSELNEYQNLLHTPISPFNKTIYQVYGLLSELSNATNVKFTYPNAEGLSDIDFTKRIQTMRELTTLIGEIGWGAYSPWSGCNLTTVTYDFRQNFDSECAKLISTLEIGEQLFAQFNKLANTQINGTYASVFDTLDFMQTLLVNLSTPKSWLCDEILRASSIYSEWTTKSATVAIHSKRDIYSIDFKALATRFKTKYRSFLRIFKGTYKQDIETLHAHSVNNEKRISYKVALGRVQEISSALNSSEDLFNLLNQLNANLEQTIPDDLIGKRIEKAKSLFNFAKKYAMSITLLDDILNNNPKKLVAFEKLLLEYSEWTLIYKDSVEYFASLFDNANAIYDLDIVTLLARAIACNNNYGELEKYIDYKQVLDECSKTGISEFVAQAEKINLSAKDITPSFEKCFYTSWLDTIIPGFKQLHTFRRKKHEDKIQEFRSLDKYHMLLAQFTIIKQLIAKIPVTSSFTSEYDEVHILNKEINKTRMVLPIRRLFASIPGILSRIKPCIMMSPLSVSTFLSDKTRFDAVVFDEASQIRTEDAIGAIFRSKQVIIAGDSKQLPPTDFFSTTTSSEDEFIPDDAEEIDDTGSYDSLLEEAVQLPSQMLLWHYRSKHEHLIEFSNKKIYEERLIIFPSATAIESNLGVQYVHVAGGTYDRGGKKGNRDEALRVCELIYEHFANMPNRSLGVIAFGETQQQAIHEALYKKRLADPKFEELFRDDRPEPFFIKNLETVQGDERDTILFSIGYAPDQNGKFSMNFGPLNKRGGERRLNVAITRARYNLKLIGSILPADISLENTHSEGPKLLREYIDFAINGSAAIANQTKENPNVALDAKFDQTVCDFLKSQGYDVVTKVGCSTYKIDLAIKDPNCPGRFAIGIECDGYSYHLAKTARERDRLRESVLTNMGWVIYRIWSTDWMKNTANEKALLLEAVSNAINGIVIEKELPTQTSISTTVCASPTLQNNSSITLVTRPPTMKKLYRPRYYGMEAKSVPLSDFAITFNAVLIDCVGITKDNLFKLVTKCYGWAHRGKVITDSLERTFNLLVTRKCIAVEHDKIKVLKTLPWT